MPPDPETPIGVFDSGVGGLSILSAIRARLPADEIIYVGDQGHVPYGPRPLEEVQAFSEGITRFLVSKGARLVVVACNAASAAALKYLRLTFPEIAFVGMEPAVKPAAEQTHSGVVGVLATPATFQGALYTSVVERFAKGVRVLQDTCPGLVARIEEGDLDGPRTEAILRNALEPMLAQGIDTVVLGCTHYPFVIPLINRIVGPQVRVIDPAPAVARQVERLRGTAALPIKKEGGVTYYTTARAVTLESVLPRLLGERAPVRVLRWVGTQVLEQD